ncbi:copper-resistance protein, CopA family [Pedobacter steynii]|uniref:Copper-resistance protein, CopA family n=1 Tax=Pedobacter steynii TaxID=430522 RepID=A0A1G9N631_9SPHI|nr:multicopper oxidase domain-containing protein [Pedobacter steynii]NQX39398.1 multicopper oxidase domain-containing protein [Pedobacter steynii]SDL81938.1 copper-resistance protein, CopA family [Pedobacter steynii]
MKKIWIAVLLFSFSQMVLAQHKGHQMPAKQQQKPELKKTVFDKSSSKVKAQPKSVRYDLYIKDTTVNYSGKEKKAIAINGSIPGPVLTFTEGDTAVVYVHNLMHMETSIHWHGVFLPNRYDGVPYLTQLPIKPHATFVYKFPVIQNGTYWYHSHTEMQEQSGMYGALIFNKVNEPEIPTIPVVLSDWTDINPMEADRFLHTANDWFAIKKGTTQSYAEAIKKGHFKTKLTNEWKRMSAMDVSDVYYEKFLSNGKPELSYTQFKAGDKVRLRMVNGGASTYFWLSYSGGKITVVGNDGNDVEPVEVDRLIIAPSETYDVVVTIPENMQYEFLSTAEDRTNSTSIWLGSGMKMPAKPLGKLKYFEGMKMMNDMMKMDGSMAPMEGMEMSNQQMDMNNVMYPEITGAETGKTKKEAEKKGHDRKAMDQKNAMGNMAGMEMGGVDAEIVTLNYGMLRATEKTTLRKGPERLLKFELTGNMDRYVWTLDNKTVSESDRILIKKGENVKIILYNNSMMRHPMHLHGHDFRVLNGQGEYAPLKNVLDILPMETDTLEFAATESGDWFFHCHILYHMMSGMGRVFSYENSPPNPEIPDPKYAQRMLNSDDRKFHLMGMAGLESNGSDGQFMLSNTRYRLSTEWRLGFKAHHGMESETYFGRYLGKTQWLFPFIGFDYHYNPVRNENEKNMFGQLSNQKNRKAITAGIQYTLPMLIVAEARVDSKGKLRFQLKREDVPITNRLRFSFSANTDKEYMTGFRYIVTKYFSLSTHYDSDMGYGGGITLSY